MIPFCPSKVSEKMRVSGNIDLAIEEVSTIVPTEVGTMSAGTDVQGSASKVVPPLTPAH